jgi:rare lipoprotein A
MKVILNTSVKIVISIFVLSIVAFLTVDNSAVLFGNSKTEFINENTELIESSSTEKLILKNKGTMTASWYGPKFNGKLTANGEIYNQMALTAAHKSLPFGTMLEITNSLNNRSIMVRINDRGPYIKGRQIDLSKGAAIALGMINKGVVKVKVKELLFDFNALPIVASN